VGFNVGGDTRNYLSQGLRVLGVEANVGLIASAVGQQPFRQALADGRLTMLNAAVGERMGGNVSFWINPNNELSSMEKKRCQIMRRGKRTKCRHTAVPVWTCAEMMRQYSVPLYVKIDIEGADFMCIDSIAHFASERRGAPRYVSSEELPLTSLALLRDAGYGGVKCQSQLEFWRQGELNREVTGMTSGPFGEEVIHMYTNSTRWEPLSPFLHEHERRQRAAKWPSKYRACPKADVHVRWGEVLAVA